MKQKTKTYGYKLIGWRARVVLAAGIIIVLNAILTLPVIIALAFVH